MAINVIPPSGPSAPAPASTDRNIDTQLFTVTGVTITPVEYAIGDILEREVIYSGSTVESTTWKNITQNSILTVTPNGSDIAKQNSVGLTDAELRAEAIHVIVDNQESSTTSTVIYSQANNAGQILAGAWSVSITNTGLADGIVLGNKLPYGYTTTFTAPPGGLLPLITYDATGTEFLYSVVKP